MIIDAHTHIFPDEQAAAILNRTARLFNVPTFGTATAADLLQRMDTCGIDRAVIHMVAPLPSQVTATNTWLIQLDQERFIKFGTLHPGHAGFRDEIARLRDHGAQGIKFQPDIQQFSPDDDRSMYPLYEAISLSGLKVMFHVGGEPLPGPNDRSKPHMIAAVARDFPHLTIIAAHLGGLNMWDDVLAHLAGLPNVYMESSLSYGYIKPKLAEKIIRTHGHKKIFFGSDYPFGDMACSLSAARTVGFLTPDERADILGRNAARFFA
ncbi:MAG: amidohydrolase [Deltaproteobacteria bacterium]|nr:amidohydrolase [Deltaproteobacteria bacterium]